MMETTIKSVSSYLRWVEKCRKNVQNTFLYKPCVYYRGQHNIAWGIEPSLFRSDMSEIIALNKACLSFPNEISGMTNLDKLILFQHYGLHTRLLDVTTNPLVALYFACADINNNDRQESPSDGVVYCGFCRNNRVNMPQIIADIAFKGVMNIDGIVVTDELVEVGKEYDFGDNMEYLISLLRQPCYVHPPLNSRRIIAQQGAFLMAPYLSVEENNVILCKKFDFLTYKGEEKYFYYKAFVPSEIKAKILSELDIMAINERSLFPEMEHVMKYINRTSPIERPTMEEMQKISDKEFKRKGISKKKLNQILKSL